MATAPSSAATSSCTSFMRALHKRPVPTEQVDAAMDRIVQKGSRSGEREIPSRQIGEMVMQELYKLDKVAYIRFASVYRSFQDVQIFATQSRKSRGRSGNAKPKKLRPET